MDGKSGVGVVDSRLPRWEELDVAIDVGDGSGAAGPPAKGEDGIGDSPRVRCGLGSDALADVALDAGARKAAVHGVGARRFQT